MTILSRDTDGLKTVEPLNCLSYDDGVLVTHWAATESSRSIALTRPELQDTLRLLSTSLLVEVLGERGIACIMGGEAPDVAAGLRALLAEQQEACGGEYLTKDCPPVRLHIETGEERPVSMTPCLKAGAF